MGSKVTQPPRGSSATASAIPSVALLREMTSEPDHRVVIKGVDWSYYEQLVDSIPEGANLHADYDGEDLEIMALSPLHDGIKKRLGRLVELTAEELEIPCTALGQMTWRRPELARGLESDECYYFKGEKLAIVAEAMTRMVANVAEYPNPDLAIEVDLTPSKIDRPGIYAALGIAEVWRFDMREPIVERLGDDGAYHPVDASGFLFVRPEEIGRWVLGEDQGDGSLWARRYRPWVRAELIARRPG